jgi:hypothetical protein
VLHSLYPRSKNPQAYLCEYFIVIVRLCHQTANFAKKSTLAQVSYTIANSDLVNFHSELELQAGYIKDEVRLLTSQTIQEEAQDSTMFRALVTKFSDSESHRRKAALA